MTAATLVAEPQVADRKPNVADLFDLDVKVTFDSTPLPEVLSSLRCGQTECCTSWWNCPWTCDQSCSDVTCCVNC